MHSEPIRTTDGYSDPPHPLPIFDAADLAADIGRGLYDALERLHREAQANAITEGALRDAETALKNARTETV